MQGPAMLVQEVAWAKMLVTYTQERGLKRGVIETFDGKHPCDLCNKAAEMRQQEQPHVRWKSDATIHEHRLCGDLYRIATLRDMLALSYRRDSWEDHLEWVWADSQNRVSVLQDEESSPGYGILNLRVAKTFTDSVRLELSLENLLDKHYTDHLGGVNRVTGGDLATGEHIPGAGRFAYVSLGWEF